MIPVVVLAFAQSALVNAEPATLSLYCKDNRLTVSAKDVPLRAVLEKIAQEAGISIVLKGPAEDLVSAESFADERALESLRTALEDTDAQVRSRAVQALGHTGDEEIAAALKKARDHSNAKVRAGAVEALASVEGEMALESLTTALGDIDRRVREVAELVSADTVGEESDETPNEPSSEEQDEGVLDEGEPDTPMLPGYPQDPVGEMERGESASKPSEQGSPADG